MKHGTFHILRFFLPEFNMSTVSIGTGGTIKKRVWITQAPGMEPAMKIDTYERGMYYFFDCLNWRKVAKVIMHIVLFIYFSHAPICVTIADAYIRQKLI